MRKIFLGIVWFFVFRFFTDITSEMVLSSRDHELWWVFDLLGLLLSLGLAIWGTVKGALPGTKNEEMKLKNKINLIALFVAFFPFGITFVAFEIAGLAHCQLDEGNIHPCYIAGHDFGELLYGMGVMGWYTVFFLPRAVIAIVINEIFWSWKARH